eukprot:2754945-Rhodomonas_salina.1
MQSSPSRWRGGGTRPAQARRPRRASLLRRTSTRPPPLRRQGRRSLRPTRGPTARRTPPANRRTPQCCRGTLPGRRRQAARGARGAHSL